MNKINVGLRVKRFLVRGVLGVALLIGGQRMCAMQEPFFVSGQQSAATGGQPVIDLKRELGFYERKATLQSKGLSAKAAERMVLDEYAVQVHRLASLLYQQDALVSVIFQLQEAHDESVSWRTRTEDEFRWHLGQDQFDLTQQFYLPVRSERSYIIALRYRDLFACREHEQVCAHELDIRRAIAFLQQQEDSDMKFWAVLLQSKLEQLSIRDREFRANTLFMQLFDVLKRQRNVCFPQNAESDRVKNFLRLQTPFANDPLSILKSFKDSALRVQLITAYTSRRAAYKQLYGAAIAQLNALLDDQAIDQGMRVVLGDSTQLLPGIKSMLNESIRTHSGPLTIKELGAEADLSWAEQEKKETAHTAEKKKKKKRAHQKKDVQEKVTITADDSEDIGHEDVTNFSTVATTLPPASEELLTIEVPDEFNRRLVAAWHLFTVEHKNKEKTPAIEQYAANVGGWQTDPDGAVREQGYYDTQSAKYRAAYAFARHRGVQYANDDQMRNYMRVYHAFPTAIDQYVRQYGRVERKHVRVGHGADTREEERLVITMVGKVQLHDGNELRGLYCYIIDPVTGICYHRMFEPVTKNPLAPDFYDIYFMSTE